MDKVNKKLISILVPVFNEEDNIIPLYTRVLDVMAQLVDRYDYEFVFTDNHSTDRTFERLEKLSKLDKRVHVYRFSRNFGFQRSIYTGYYNAKGHAAIQLDCDLQDPPELITEFVRYWEEGYQVVYGIRQTRKEGWVINRIRNVFYWLIDILSEDILPRDAGDFRLVDRRVINELRKIDDYQPYLRGTIAAMGFKQIGIPYDRAERMHGKSKFSLGGLFKLATDGILNHSIIPLRISTFTGLTISLLTFLGILGYFFGKLFLGKEWPAGFATTTTLILLSLSLNALFLGIIGEYLGRIYQQVKKRPMTIIESEINPQAKTDVNETDWNVRPQAPQREKA
ncbi:MAG TPA: glycosyltransferase family 2 protein [Candidatus Aquicultor sp.]|jgi:dolichol-phosphate mannosyltransferase